MVDRQFQDQYTLRTGAVCNEGVCVKKKRKVNCWEYKKCGREPDGAHVHDLGECPAAKAKKLDGIHNGESGGRSCWIVAGTMCDGKIQGTFAKKYDDCKICDFYKKVVKEEGKEFVFSTILLGRLNTPKKKS